MAENETLELLPAYVNGTLSDEDRVRVDRELETSETLRKELEFLNAMRSSVKDQAVDSPTEWGWHRLQREIGKATPAGRFTNNVWKISAVAAALVVAVQTGYIAQQPDVAGYQTLSGPISEELLLQVRLDPDARQEDVQELLLSIEADIVSGPSAIGLYHISVKDADAALEILESSDVVIYVNRD